MKRFITYKLRDNNLKFDDLNELQTIMKRLDIVSSEKPYRIHKTILKDEPNMPQHIVNKLYQLDHKLRYFKKIYEDKEQHFEVFKIPKKSGGLRTITAPDEALKEAYTRVQKFLEEDLKILPHQNAWAYMSKRSTLHAVQVHQANNSQWFLKVDIEKFFDSCDHKLIRTQLMKIYPLHFHQPAVENLATFATFNNELPQGTPLSPYLTNLIMIPFDYYFSKYCENNNLIYTRYADDIIISSEEEFKFSSVINKMQDILVENDYRFKINKEKTRYGNRNGRNWNLGLMLNKDNQITLGHKFKRQIKVILYKLYHQELAKDDPHLIGLISYLKQIEPVYYQGLNNYAIQKFDRSIDTLLKSD